MIRHSLNEEESFEEMQKRIMKRRLQNWSTFFDRIKEKSCEAEDEEEEQEVKDDSCSSDSIIQDVEEEFGKLTESLCHQLGISPEEISRLPHARENDKGADTKGTSEPEDFVDCNSGSDGDENSACDDDETSTRDDDETSTRDDDETSTRDDDETSTNDDIIKAKDLKASDFVNCSSSSNDDEHVKNPLRNVRPLPSTSDSDKDTFTSENCNYVRDVSPSRNQHSVKADEERMNLKRRFRLLQNVSFGDRKEKSEAERKETETMRSHSLNRTSVALEEMKVKRFSTDRKYDDSVEREKEANMLRSPSQDKIVVGRIVRNNFKLPMYGSTGSKFTSQSTSLDKNIRKYQKPRQEEERGLNSSHEECPIKTICIPSVNEMLHSTPKEKDANTYCSSVSVTSSVDDLHPNQPDKKPWIAEICNQYELWQLYNRRKSGKFGSVFVVSNLDEKPSDANRIVPDLPPVVKKPLTPVRRFSLKKALY